MGYIDLHVHSNKSDGTFSPAELVAYALEKKLDAIALTDHDTTDGIEEAFAAAQGTSLEIVPGIEFSTEYNGRDIHILGLDINYKSEVFQQKMVTFQSARNERNREMADRLRDLKGFDISLEQLQEMFGDAVLTRAHYAKYLHKNGYIKEIRDAFDKYIGDRGPCFVSRSKIMPRQAVQLILDAGGIPILAHPLLYHLSESELDALVSELKVAGLQGLEAIYVNNTGMDESNMRRLARKYDLKLSGGSDFHGSIKPTVDLGVGKSNLKIPYEILKNLRS